MSTPETARVVEIHIATTPGGPLLPRDGVNAIAGQGLEGDRNCAPGAKPDSQLTLIEAEALESIAVDHGIHLLPGASRRNITTRGVRLNELVGKTFQVGEATARGIELCEPCRSLEKSTGEKLIGPLTHRGGLRAEILTTGTIRTGDAIKER